MNLDERDLKKIKSLHVMLKMPIWILEKETNKVLKSYESIYKHPISYGFKEKNISEVLEMRVSDAVNYFKHIPKIERKLQTIVDVGLGYVTLGQPATTLSGGEAQRMKLASELQKRSTGKSFYILDEPTTGLHTEDIATLLGVLNRLVEQGNTIVVIEHNLDVIKTADHIIDLGPEGGVGGGTIIATGTPEEVAANEASYTGHYLKGKLHHE